MPKVTTVRFARFCEADADKRPSIAYGSKGFDYHLPLKHLLRVSHRMTNEVEILERVLATPEPFSQVKPPSKVEALNSSGRDYLEFWHTLEGAAVMAAPRVTVDFHGLNIVVDPEVVVSVGATDARVLKLSFGKGGGANIHAKDDRGLTPLHYAAISSRDPSVGRCCWSAAQTLALPPMTGSHPCTPQRETIQSRQSLNCCWATTQTSMPQTAMEALRCITR